MYSSSHVNNNNYWIDVDLPSSDNKSLMKRECRSDKFSTALNLSSNYSFKVYHNCVQMISCEIPPKGLLKKIPRGEKIKEFSVNSKRRLSQKLNQIRFDLYATRFFVTLTFHDDFPVTGLDLKKMLDRFQKKLHSEINGLGLVWRLEFQDRGAPHFHFFVLSEKRSCGFTKNHLSRIIRDSWFSLFDFVSESHKIFGCDIREIVDDSKTCSYICKYVGKIDESSKHPGFGRRWGTSNNLMMDAHYNLFVDSQYFHRLRSRLLEHLQSVSHLDNSVINRLGININITITCHLSTFYDLALLVAHELDRSDIIDELHKCHNSS